AVFFGVHHSGLLRRTFLPGAATLRLAFVTLLGLGRALTFLQPVAKLRPSRFAIGGLRAARLAAHLYAGGFVSQPNRRGSLVDFLPAGAGSAHKPLIHVLHPHMQCGQPPDNLGWNLHKGTVFLGTPFTPAGVKPGSNSNPFTLP